MYEPGCSISIKLLLRRTLVLYSFTQQGYNPAAFFFYNALVFAINILRRLRSLRVCNFLLVVSGNYSLLYMHSKDDTLY